MKLTPCGWAFLRAEPQVGVRKKQTIKHTPNMLRIAIQAKGRLNEQSIDLLSDAVESPMASFAIDRFS